MSSTVLPSRRSSREKSRDSHHGMGDCLRTFAPRHDVIWFATKGKVSFFNGRPHSVLRYRKVANQAIRHPTEKPVPLMLKLVRHIVPDDGSVLDPCMGTGPTGVAAARLGRRFTGIELDGNYFKIACERINAEMN